MSSKRKRVEEDESDGGSDGDAQVPDSQMSNAGGDIGDDDGSQIGEAQLGIVEKVKLVNFMNHSHFEVSFGPNINFIVGENGSGKSAVLVAIAICLGANPRFTSRAQRLGGLVQHGKDSCTIAVTLRNRGPEAYKPDEFGESITVERTLNKEGGSQWRLIADNGHIVSRTKKDVDQVLDVFGTQVDNPCCVLMQDTAKKFLRESKPENLYHFFLEATQLQQMREDYDSVKEFIQISKATLAVKSRAVPELKRKQDALRHEAELAKQQRRSVEQLKLVTAKLAWVIVRAKEMELSATVAQLEGVQAQSTRVQEKRETALKQQNLLSVRVQEGEREAKEAAERVQEAEGRVTDLQRRKQAIEREQAQKRQKMKDLSAVVGNAKRRQGTLKDEIGELRKKLAADAGKEQKALADELSRCARELSAHEDELRARELRRDEAEERSDSFNERFRTVEAALSRAREELNRAQRAAQAMGSAGSSVRSRLLAFGEDMPRVQELIDANKGRFKHVPVGPIGLLCKLKPGMDSWAKAVDTAMDRNAQAYVVDSHADETALRNLCSQNGVKMPNLIVQRFVNERYQIPSNALPPGPTALDVLDISHTMVFNALVDQASLERVVLVKDLDEAKRRVFRANDSRVSQGVDVEGRKYQLRGATEIVVPPFERYKPRLQVSDEQQRRVLKEQQDRAKADVDTRERQRAELTAEKQTLDGAVKEAQAKAREQANKVAQARAELEQRQSELTSARSVDHAAMIAQLEEQLRGLVTEEQSAERELKRLGEERSAQQEQARPLQGELEAASAAIEELGQRAEKSSRDLEKAVAAQEHCRSAVVKIDTLLANYAKTADTLAARQAALGAEIDKETDSARKIALERPEMSDEETLERLQRDHARLKKLVADGSEGRRPEAEVVQQLHAVTQSVMTLERDLTRLQKLAEKLESSVGTRINAWRYFRTLYSKRTQMNFSSYLSRRRFTGSVTFEHGHDNVEGRMFISVNPNKADWQQTEEQMQQQQQRDKDKDKEKEKKRRSSAGPIGDAQTSTQGLSGGDTVSLLLALWDVMEMPFCAMDEFDVFMDQVNRRMSVQMLIGACETRSERQYIFISPHTTAHIPQNKPHVRLIRMRPPERGQTTLNFDGH